MTVFLLSHMYIDSVNLFRALSKTASLYMTVKISIVSRRKTARKIWTESEGH